MRPFLRLLPGVIDTIFPGQSACHGQLVSELHAAAERDLHEPPKFGFALSGTPFCEIRWNADNSSPDLTRQTVLLLLWEQRREGVHGKHKVVCEIKDF
jgi:hypothetical protein